MENEVQLSSARTSTEFNHDRKISYKLYNRDGMVILATSKCHQAEK
jgi:hypothetical protein